MADAEMELMPLLRKSASAEDLNALQRRILADLGTETVQAMTREVVRAVAECERVRFLQTPQRFGPAVALPAVWWSTRGVWRDENLALEQTIGDERARMVLG